MMSANATSSNTILVMTSSTRTCSLLTEFLSTMDTEASPGSRGRQMMMKKLRLYLWWKGKLSQRKQDGKTPFAMPSTNKDNFDNYGNMGEISEALKKKDKEKAEKSKFRRRVRGGAPAGSSSSSSRAADNTSFPKPEPTDLKLDEIHNEADRFAQL
jgi:DNA excision repair protein ERCC-4